MRQIIKASAGSGKTFILARTYIEILLKKYTGENKRTDGYQNILAVTFTNKATAEMKERIITELHILATDPYKSSYINDFVPKYGTHKQVQEMCGKILGALLHDYSRFSISTIDTFFQSVLRSFARELGQFNAYRIELDRKGVVDESVDLLLDTLQGEADELVNILVAMANEKMLDGKKTNLIVKLRSYAEQIKSGDFARALEVAGLDLKTSFPSDKMKTLSDLAKKRQNEIVPQLSDLAQTLQKKLKDILGDDYDKCLMKGFRDDLDNFIKGNPKAFSKKKEFYCGEYKYYSSRSLKGERLDNCNDVACTLLKEIYPLIKDWLTCEVIKDSIPMLSLANRVIEAFNQVTKGKNIMCLDESTQLLGDLIDGSEAPFIYEKMGVRYDSFLLDEFQDTSNIQWKNFTPLLEESKSVGGDILVVGDTKQSIYRFRDTDWTILEDKVPVLLDVKPENIKSNWRSGKLIVNFNNNLFESLPNILDEAIKKNLGTSKESVVEDIYPVAGVHQNVQKDWDGMVDVAFVPKENMISQTLETIDKLHSNGIPYCRILVLVRRKDDGGLIAEKLVEKGISVCSEESLVIDSDPLARRLLAVLRYIDNPTDNASKFMIDHDELDIPTSYTSLVDLCEQIILSLSLKFSDTFDKSIPYLDAFVDLVKTHEENYGNSLHTMLDGYARKKNLIASAPSRDAVQIMTIHKSKGLAGYFVILPFLDEIDLFKVGNKWTTLDDGAPLTEEFSNAIYYPVLSSKSVNTYFSNKYADEYRQSIVDNINLLYVALTRAQFGLFLIGESKEKRDKCSNFSDYVYSYVSNSPLFKENHYSEGSLDDTAEKAKEQDAKDLAKETNKNGEHIELGYPVCLQRGRMRLSNEARDFFASDCAHNFESSGSARLRGIVLHDILSKVLVINDLPAAVEAQAVSGTLENKDEVLAFLSKSISDVASYGWFNEGNKVMNEREIVSSGGFVYRPDRVIIRKDGSLDVVDYKFGSEHNEDYHAQVANYCSLLREMGYKNVNGYIWYVTEGKVVDTEAK